MIEVTDGFVATVGEAVVGWANLDGNEVDQLYVDPDAGGQGVARRLYETIKALARANVWVPRTHPSSSGNHPVLVDEPAQAIGSS